MIRTQAFGVRFAFVDDDVPGLAPAAAPDPAPETVVKWDAAGVSARWEGARPTRTREVRDRERVHLSVDHDERAGYLIDAPGIGTALVDCAGLDVRGAPGPDSAEWLALLVGQVLPLVATVRGLEVFHASAVTVGSRAYLFTGPQRVGKTSLAAQLTLRGAQLLSDDVVAVDDRLVAHPGSAVLHVRDAELARLAAGSAGRLEPRGVVRGRDAFRARVTGIPAPVGAIYLLQRDDGPAAIERVQPISPLALVRCTFNVSVRTPQRLTHHLDLCARLTAQVPVFRLQLGSALGSGGIAELLLAHIAQHPLPERDGRRAAP